jgi:hypothetical protein
MDAIVVGIDVSKDKLDIAVLPWVIASCFFATCAGLSAKSFRGASSHSMKMRSTVPVALYRRRFGLCGPCALRDTSPKQFEASRHLAVRPRPTRLKHPWSASQHLGAGRG